MAPSSEPMSIWDLTDAPRVLASSYSRVPTTLGPQSNSSTAMIGRVDCWRFVRIDSPVAAAWALAGVVGLPEACEAASVALEAAEEDLLVGAGAASVDLVVVTAAAAVATGEMQGASTPVEAPQCLQTLLPITLLPAWTRARSSTSETYVSIP